MVLSWHFPANMDTASLYPEAFSVYTLDDGTEEVKIYSFTPRAIVGDVVYLFFYCCFGPGCGLLCSREGCRDSRDSLPRSIREPDGRGPRGELHPAVPCASVHGGGIHFDVGALERYRSCGVLLESVYDVHVVGRRETGI